MKSKEPRELGHFESRRVSLARKKEPVAGIQDTIPVDLTSRGINNKVVHVKVSLRSRRNQHRWDVQKQCPDKDVTPSFMPFFEILTGSSWTHGSR